MEEKAFALHHFPKPDIPAFVLMPGLDGTGRLYAPLKKLLSTHCFCRSLTYPPALLPLLSAYADHAIAQLPGHEPLLLIAESFSGPIAIELAHRLGGRVRGLVLCASFATPPHPLLRLAPYLPDWLPEKLMHSRTLLCRYCLGQGASDELFDDLFATLCLLDIGDVKSRLDLLSRIDVAKTLQSLRIPLLILRPDADRLVTRHASRRLEQAAQEATVVLLHGPHFLFQAKPHESCKAIMAWASERKLV